MADEASPSATNTVAGGEDEAMPTVESAGMPDSPMPDSDKAQKDDDALMAGTTGQKPLQKKALQKDFFLCCLLLIVFGVLCAIGFIVLRILVFSEGTDMAQLLVKHRDDSATAQSTGLFNEK